VGVDQDVALHGRACVANKQRGPPCEAGASMPRAGRRSWLERPDAGASNSLFSRTVPRIPDSLVLQS
jgi:hypothetical protein